MKCERCLQQLSQYLDRDLDPGLRHEIEAHLVMCRDCEIVFNTTRRTIELYCDGRLFALPPSVRTRLHQALRRRRRTSA